jgi:ribosomal protein S18 acetylase RimI-like enzyme
MITYLSSAEGVKASQLKGFFVGWNCIPNKEAHLKLLKQSEHVVLAVEEDCIVGFITAISDGVLSAYIPFFEVLPEYQERGIGTELMKRMLEQLKDIYMIDLICDEDKRMYYEKFGMSVARGMMLRNYNKQQGSFVDIKN